MAKYNYDSYKAKEEAKKESGNYLKYFSLKDDKDFAYIRFAYATYEEFLKTVDIVDVHRIQDKDHKFPQAVACLREKGDPKEKCPLCAKGDDTEKKVSTKVYLKVIEYVPTEKNTNKFTKNEQGVIEPTAKIWERPGTFVDDVLPYIEDGDATKLFKVVRNGVAGNTKTTYNLIPMQKEIYPDTLFVKDFSGFDDYKAPYVERTAEQMERYLETGYFFDSSKEEKKEEPKGDVVEIGVTPTPKQASETTVLPDNITIQEPDGVVTFEEKKAEVKPAVEVAPQRARRDYSQYN